MNILSDEQYEVLSFVAACNRSSFNPTASQILLWREHPEPAEAEYRLEKRPGVDLGSGGLLGPANPAILAGLQGPTSGSFLRMYETMLNEQIRPATQHFAKMLQSTLGTDRYVQKLVKPAETAIDHLIRLTWLEAASGVATDDPGLRLTDLGRALLRDRDQDSPTDEGVSVVVLQAHDPLAYPILVGQLANAGAGLLADPYLKIDGLNRLVVSTQLTRVLVSGKSNNNGELSAMQTYLDSSSLPRPIEVRKSTELHDRVLLNEDGAVLTIGTSLNGIGRTTTVMTPMPSPARQSLRAEYERLWTEAVLVGPQPDEGEAGETATDDEPPTPSS